MNPRRLALGPATWLRPLLVGAAFTLSLRPAAGQPPASARRPVSGAHPAQPTRLGQPSGPVHLTEAQVRTTALDLARALRSPARWARHRQQAPRLEPLPSAGGWVVLRAQPTDIQGDFANPEVLRAFLLQALAGAEDHLGDLSLDFLVVLTGFEVARPEAAYLPLANDVRGLGYRHLGLAPDEVFRTGAAPRLAGLVFLNHVRRHLPAPEHAGDPARGRYLFLHELGHRFGAYARFRDGDGALSDRWLGRDCAHWSHFAQTDGSALEGNRWTPLDPAQPAAGHGAGPAAPFGYSLLDRYLMGFVPAAAVPPQAVVGPTLAFRCSEPRRDGAPNPTWAPPLAAEDAPATVGPGLEAVPIEALVAAEGARQPAWPETQWTFRAVFVLVLGPDEALGPGEAAALEALRRDWTAAWIAAAQPPPAWRAPGGARPLLVTSLDGVPDVPLPPEDGPDGGAPDGGALDAALPDGGALDGALPDGGALDAALPDGRAPDAQAQDQGGPEAALAADAQSDRGGPDAQTGAPDRRTSDGGCAQAGAAAPEDAGGPPWTPLLGLLVVGALSPRRPRRRCADGSR